MAPFQLRVRKSPHATTDDFRLRRCSRWRGPHSARRLAISPELRTTTPPHGTPWAQPAGYIRAKVSTRREPRTRTPHVPQRSPPCRRRCQIQSGLQPIILSPGARPPTGLTNSVPLRSASHPLCPEPYVVSHHSSEGPIPRSLNVSITPTVTPASLPLDGVTSTWVITCIAFPSSHVSATCTPLPLVSAVGYLRVVRRLIEYDRTSFGSFSASAPSPLPHRRHRLRDDRPCAHDCSPNSLAEHAVPRRAQTGRRGNVLVPRCFPLSLRYRCARPSPIPSPRPGCSRLTANRNTRTVSQNRPNRVNTAILLDVRRVQALLPRSHSQGRYHPVRLSLNANRPPSCSINRTRKLCSVFWARCASSISSRSAWCHSRLNSNSSNASMSVRSNISLSTSTPSTVCTARFGLPMSGLYIGANRSSSMSTRASPEHLRPAPPHQLRLPRRDQKLRLPKALLRFPC